MKCREASEDTVLVTSEGRGFAGCVRAVDSGPDRKTIRAILKRKKVKASTLAKVVTGLREE